MKKKKIIYIAAAITLTLGCTLYGLADRYLIEHVEVANISTTSLAASTQTDSVQADSTGTSQDAAEAADNTGTAQDSAGTSAQQDATGNDSEADAEASSTDGETVSVQKVTTGSGSNTVTYYVADVVLSDASDLKSAFAKDSFGTNIIEYTSTIAENNDASFAINGDYYGFRDDGIIIRNGVIYRDVPARTGLAFYSDGTMAVYDETQTTAEELLAAGVINTYSFGPALLDDGSVVEGLSEMEVDTNFGNHSIQGNQPRTGIGMIDANHFVFIVVDGRSKGYSRGVTLEEFAQIFQDLGCTEAYNMDGGGSSAMYYNGELVNNPLGKNKERGTSDIIYIQ